MKLLQATKDMRKPAACFKQTAPVCKNVHTFLDICVLSEEIKYLLTDCNNYGTSEQPN